MCCVLKSDHEQGATVRPDGFRPVTKLTTLTVSLKSSKSRPNITIVTTKRPSTPAQTEVTASIVTTYSTVTDINNNSLSLTEKKTNSWIIPLAIFITVLVVLGIGVTVMVIRKRRGYRLASSGNDHVTSHQPTNPVYTALLDVEQEQTFKY